jgi:hypothetical protein
MNLYFDLDPAERGLVQRDDSPVWAFPPDYIERLTASLEDRGVTREAILGESESSADQ